MTIRVPRLGTGIKEVHLDTGCVEDALTASCLSSEGLEVYLNRRSVLRSHPFQDGDLVTLVPASN
jgi:hypothetical protein